MGRAAASILAISITLAGQPAFADYHPGDNPQYVEGMTLCELFDSCTNYLSDEQLQRTIYYSDCISFEEFRNGWYSELNGISYLERRDKRKEDRLFQIALEYIFNNAPPNEDQITQFQKIVDKDGRTYEALYNRGVYGDAALKRSDVFLTDHCNY